MAMFKDKSADAEKAWNAKLDLLRRVHRDAAKKLNQADPQSKGYVEGLRAAIDIMAR